MRAALKTANADVDPIFGFVASGKKKIRIVWIRNLIRTIPDISYDFWKTRLALPQRQSQKRFTENSWWRFRKSHENTLFLNKVMMFA